MTAATPLVFNPAAGGGRGAATAEVAIAKLEAAGIAVTPTPTEGPGGARELAARLAKEGHTRILVLGGDGTLSEAADGLLATGKNDACALGCLPSGTGNDFLRDFGVTDLDEAIARIASGAERRVDAGRVEHADGVTHTINVFGTGFMANVGDFTNRHLKWMGPKGYTFGVFPVLVRFRAPPTRITLDGVPYEVPLSLVGVCNSKHTGGKMMIAPMAEQDDGLLDVIALGKVGRIGLLRLFPKIFDGSHIGKPKVSHWRAKEIRIEPAEDGPLIVDGEIFGRTPCTVTVLPAALRMLL